MGTAAAFCVGRECRRRDRTPGEQAGKEDRGGEIQDSDIPVFSGFREE